MYRGLISTSKLVTGLLWHFARLCKSCCCQIQPRSTSIATAQIAACSMCSQHTQTQTPGSKDSHHRLKRNQFDFSRKNRPDGHWTARKFALRSRYTCTSPGHRLFTFLHIVSYRFKLTNLDSTVRNPARPHVQAWIAILPMFLYTYNG